MTPGYAPSPGFGAWIAAHPAAAGVILAAGLITLAAPAARRLTRRFRPYRAGDNR
jgi:ABC-type Mn2+/Zn2+ transport system permease subunit